MYLLRNAQIEESVPFFEAAIKKQTWRNPNPYSGEGYFNLGLALELLDRLEPAYDAFFKATWSAETAGAAYHHLSCICVKQKKLVQALKFADESGDPVGQLDDDKKNTEDLTDGIHGSLQNNRE